MPELKTDIVEVKVTVVRKGGKPATYQFTPDHNSKKGAATYCKATADSPDVPGWSTVAVKAKRSK